MSVIISKLNEDTEVLIEVDDKQFGIRPTGKGSTSAKVIEDAFSRSLTTILNISNQFTLLKEQFKANPPEQMEITFGIKISGEGNIWVARVSSEAQITARLRWKISS